jgi:SPX domain protein involved in polyphosphate accumulation/uncharacterized membrane protein YidH (DUF202 family)
MKFGEHLLKNMDPRWKDYYLDYARMKKVIKELSASCLVDVSQERNTSLSFGRGAAASSRQAHDANRGFLDLLEEEIRKIDKFTAAMMVDIRTNLRDIEGQVEHETKNNNGGALQGIEELRKQADHNGKQFLALEKYINLNFNGFHKILKKHDKQMPLSFACKNFYVGKLHQENWVKGDYSDVLVQLSRIHSKLRQDKAAAANHDAAQAFVRTTTKYWVKTEDCTRVKYNLLQQLPVFLQEGSAPGSDSQLTNSVYLDNGRMELYKGRLDKTPGAIALRLRWYGSGDPKDVFVERKTHRESWTGELSVKERFIIKEKYVLSLLDGTFDRDAHLEEMKAAGNSEADLKAWETLVSEVQEAIASKQLQPTMRTQCMRVAYQIPFDATVRVSLDTNLCMITEGPHAKQDFSHWYRDPEQPVPFNQITRFPHAVLEVKLCLPQDELQPQWVSDLIDSDMLLEVHKFSKFIHGSATLLPEEVQSVPYWIDEPSLRSSIMASGGGVLALEESEVRDKGDRSQSGVDPSASQKKNAALNILEEAKDLHPKKSKSAVPVNPTSGGSNLCSAATALKQPLISGQPSAQGSINDDGAGYGSIDASGIRGTRQASCISRVFEACGDCMTVVGGLGTTGSNENNPVMRQRKMPVKIEPKVFFANERTFLAWLHMAVTIASVSVAILAFSKEHSDVSQVYGLILLPLSIVFCAYALYTFQWRRKKIQERDPGPYDDGFGPVVLASTLTVCLTINFFLNLWEYTHEEA